MSKVCVNCSTTSTAKWYSGPTCKKCYRKQWYEKNKSKEKISMRSYYNKNAESLKEYAKKYYEENKELILEKTKKYKRDFYHRNKQKDALYRERNREKIRLRKQRYYQKNKKKIQEKRNQYLDKNIGAKLAARIRTRLYLAIKDKSLSLPEYLGCTTQVLMAHLQSQFQSGMSWDNYGEWHIDHIAPLSSFNLEEPEELARACHYSNLQPLWAGDNLRKGGRL